MTTYTITVYYFTPDDHWPHGSTYQIQAPSAWEAYQKVAKELYEKEKEEYEEDAETFEEDPTFDTYEEFYTHKITIYTHPGQETSDEEGYILKSTELIKL